MTEESCLIGMTDEFILFARRASFLFWKLANPSWRPGGLAAGGWLIASFCRPEGFADDRVPTNACSKLRDKVVSVALPKLATHRPYRRARQIAETTLVPDQRSH